MASRTESECIGVAAREDLAEILRLQKLAFTEVAEASGDMKISPMVQTLADLEVEHGKRVVFKYVLDSKIVGSVRGHVDDAGTCHIGRLVVDPAYQRRGIGSRLMDRIEEHFAGCRRIEIFTGRVTPNTIRMYEKRGYRIFRTEALSFGEMVFMEKRGAAAARG